MWLQSLSLEMGGKARDQLSLLQVHFIKGIQLSLRNPEAKIDTFRVLLGVDRHPTEIKVQPIGRKLMDQVSFQILHPYTGSKLIRLRGTQYNHRIPPQSELSDNPLMHQRYRWTDIPPKVIHQQLLSEERQHINPLGRFIYFSGIYKSIFSGTLPDISHIRNILTFPVE